ncbi:hypothetical protein DICSQDRAFT_139279 [Dichomitus squalens LYAD-421 SS1]|uniref:WD40-repeat-containing domain protein n=1 Tax=Dichomitus squalens (strain LYAD-421) TaxID=732165 RepID=R7SUQ5_DICSQ|nr:uncharacterized protein DICSQDRAFT_139279 [Dichomitus squalens LYAD-421 SS1]EJF58667.1 hypothetical protein DICSQDRAFT_139279 [Dichomitus squalens LYAD-421 SS1]
MVNLGTIWMWDTETREPVGENLSNPFGSVHSLALSPDGRHIVSRSNTIIVVWDANAFTDPCGPHPPFVNYNTMSRTSFDGSFQSSTPPEYPYWNGWITDKNGNHVMWVPDEYRDCLLWRGMVKVMGRESITIKFPNAFSGTEWAKCYRPHYRPQTSA